MDICHHGLQIPTILRFRHERILSNQEINLINDWIGLGAPEGNPNLTPPAPPTILVVHNLEYQIHLVRLLSIQVMLFKMMTMYASLFLVIY